jgi:hypothetical protein
MSQDLEELYTKPKIYQQEVQGIPLSSIWKHYKGDLYKVVGFVMIESNQEIGVCYVSLDYPTIYPWMRPVSEWTQKVNPAEDLRRFTLFGHMPAITDMTIEEHKKQILQLKIEDIEDPFKHH